MTTRRHPDMPAAERRALVIKLWGEGLTSSVLAAQVGLTRNAVLGIVHRDRMSRGESPGRRATSRAAKKLAGAVRGERKPVTPVRKPAPAATEAPPAAFRVPEAPSPAVTATSQPAGFPASAVSILDVRHGQCRWVVGREPSGFRLAMFCGAPAEKQSWCSHHAAIGISASRGPKPRTRLTRPLPTVLTLRGAGVL